MGNQNYKNQLNKRLQEVGVQIASGNTGQISEVEALYHKVKEIIEEVRDTGTILPFERASTLLEWSPYEELVACYLWQQTKEENPTISYEQYAKNMRPYPKGEQDYMRKGCFLHTSDTIQLSPVLLSFLEERSPQLPEGMEFRYVPIGEIYGNKILIEEAVRLIEGRGIGEHNVAMVLWGTKGSGRRYLMDQISALSNVAYILLDAERSVYSPYDLYELMLTSIFYDTLPVIWAGSSNQEVLLQQLSTTYSLVVLLQDKPYEIELDCGYGMIQHYVEPPSKQLKMEIIEQLLHDYDCSDKLPPRVTKDQIASRQLGAGAYLRYCKNLCLALISGNHHVESYVHQTNSTNLTMLPTTRSLEELKVPQAQETQLRKICKMIAAKEAVLEEWGFQEKFAYGNGMTLLFYGSPGTGKTMAAQVMAHELGMPLYRVDLSQLISKYIGETQKNIGKIFEEADKCNCILLFDEADALFAKRSDVSDAQDRYSNAETAYLLQRIEQYGGVSILATNLLQNFDDAFRRRISYMVHFPLPDQKLRLSLWETIFPKEASVSSEVDYLTLSQAFELSGAAIKSAALHGAYLAKGEGVDISMKHILDGIQNEYSKIGKNLSQSQQDVVDAYLAQ